MVYNGYDDLMQKFHNMEISDDDLLAIAVSAISLAGNLAIRLAAHEKVLDHLLGVNGLRIPHGMSEDSSANVQRERARMGHAFQELNERADVRQFRKALQFEGQAESLLRAVQGLERLGGLRP
jgi:hypothetical protein